MLPDDHIHPNPHSGLPRYFGKFLGVRQMPLYLPPLPGLGS